MEREGNRAQSNGVHDFVSGGALRSTAVCTNVWIFKCGLANITAQCAQPRPHSLVYMQRAQLLTFNRKDFYIQIGSINGPDQRNNITEW